MDKNELFHCECGAKIRPACKSVHLNTMKHRKFLQSNGHEVPSECPEWVNSRKAYQKEYNKKYNMPTFCELCQTTVKVWKQHVNTKGHKHRALRQVTVDYVVDHLFPTMIEALEQMDCPHVTVI